MKKRIPNCLTVLRFAGAAALLFLEPLSIPFYCVYAACGALDYLDGSVARVLNAESLTGFRLDHIASLVFIAFATVCFMKSVPMSDWLFFWMCGIIVVKLMSLIVGAVRFRIPAFINTTLNKTAKAAFFFFPLWLWFAGVYFAFITVLAFCSIACIEELVINVSSKEYDKDKASLIKFGKKSKKRSKNS